PEVGKLLLCVDDDRRDAEHLGFCDGGLHLILPLPHVDRDREEILDPVLLFRQEAQRDESNPPEYARATFFAVFTGVASIFSSSLLFTASMRSLLPECY